MYVDIADVLKLYVYGRRSRRWRESSRVGIPMSQSDSNGVKVVGESEIRSSIAMAVM